MNLFLVHKHPNFKGEDQKQQVCQQQELPKQELKVGILSNPISSVDHNGNVEMQHVSKCKRKEKKLFLSLTKLVQGSMKIKRYSLVEANPLKIKEHKVHS